MNLEDLQEWEEAYDNYCQGLFEHVTLRMVRPEPGAKVIGNTTWI